MALLATFGADFSQLRTAIDSVELKFEDMSRAAKNVSRDMNTLVYSLDGTKIAREAEMAAKAIESVGGVSKLTASEAARMSVPINEAIAKYRAMGVEVPPHLQKVGAELSSVNQTGGLMPMIMAQIGPAVMSAFSISAVVGFARSVMEAADQIVKLSEQTGMSTDEIQKLQYLSLQTSVSVDGMAGAVQMLQQRLGDGDKGAVGALRALGFVVDSFLALSPYDQFMALSQSIGEIEDPILKAKIASELFGRAWRELIPVLREGMQGLADDAPRMSTQVVTYLDRAGDAAMGLGSRMKTWALEASLWFPIVVLAARDIYGELRDRGKEVVETTESEKDARIRSRLEMEKWREENKLWLGEVASHTKSYVEHIKEQAAVDRELSRELEEMRKNAEKVQETFDYMGKTTHDIALKMQRDVAEANQKIAESINKSIASQLATYEDFKQKNELALLSGTELKLKQIDIEQQKVIEAAGQQHGVNSELYRMMLAEIQTYYDRQRELAVEGAQTFQTSFTEAAAAVKTELGNVWGSLTSPGSPFVGGTIASGAWPAGVVTREQKIQYVLAHPALGGLDSYGNPYLKLTAMAAGGPVNQGQPYLVGELGPELFVPSTNGTVVPNGAGTGAVTVTLAPGSVVLNYPIMNDPTAKTALAALVGDAIVTRLRSVGVRLPSGA